MLIYDEQDRLIVQGGMETKGVVEAEDDVVDIACGLHWVGVSALPQALHFEIQKEALDDGVIPAVALAAHAGDEAVSGEQLLMLLAGILAAAVGGNPPIFSALQK